MFKNLKFKINSGFTLIELLVVMAIIAVLSALSLAGLGAARKASRDTRRKNDLGQYRVALENWSQARYLKFPSRTGIYTPSTGAGFGIHTNNLCANAIIAGSVSFSLYNGQFLPTCIFDPLRNGTGDPVTDSCNFSTYNYCYIPDIITSSGNATAYYLIAKLEGGGFWIVCSNGKVGKMESPPLSLPPSSSISLSCPLP